MNKEIIKQLREQCEHDAVVFNLLLEKDGYYYNL